MSPSLYRQPLLHDLDVTLAAPTALLASATGDVDAATVGGGAQGLFHADVRALSRIRLTVSGEEPEHLRSSPTGPGEVHIVSLARNLDGAGADPTVRLERARTVSPGQFTERLSLVSTATEPVTAVVRIEVGSDLLALEQVKAGYPGVPVPSRLVGDRQLKWSRNSTTVLLSAPDAVLTAESLQWTLEVPPRQTVSVEWRVEVGDQDVVVGPPPQAPTWSRPHIRADDRRLVRWSEQSLDDAHGLRMSLFGQPQDVFLAAGTPWFFTLFGRDSLWAARMMLPLGTDLARGTLRVLARLQGTRDDPASEQEPGKILHELRRSTFDDGTGLVLPPIYYGSVDSTALWVCLLHDAWRWGMAGADVEALLPMLERALAWIRHSAQSGQGFLRYADHSGAGLANQGWKDSGDAIRYRDGTLAGPPVALAEVQGYAHEAARSGAALLEAFGRPGAQDWHRWADDLADRFRSSFWSADERGAYPAMALDGSGRPVDAIASNMAHLLGTGLLDDKETALVVDRITAPDLADGYGLRTMSALAGGYAPLSYHCGTVWPHDTAIAVAGLARTGNGHRAGELVEGLLAASVAFEGRLPELWGGDPRRLLPAPVPYPAACRPQAWAATAAISLLSSVLGLAPDVPAGTLTLRPAKLPALGALSVTELRLATYPLGVALHDDGSIASVTTKAPVTVLRPGS